VAYDAGTAFLQIEPSFVNLESLLAKGAREIAKNLDRSLGKQLGTAMQNAGRQADAETAKAGQVLGKTFADNAIKRVRAGLANIPEGDRVLSGLRKELVAISEIDVTKGFNEKDFIARVERAQTALRKAQQDAQGVNAVGRFTNAGNAAQELGAVRDIVDAARKRGFAAGDAFSDAYLTRLKAMDKALPDLLTREGSTPDQRQVAALKQRIQDAAKLKIGDTVTADNNPLNLKLGVKIDGDDLKREMGNLEGLLDQFTERSGTIELALATDKARQQAGGFFNDIKTQEQRAAEDQAAVYLKAWDDAYKEQAKRDRQFREDLGRAHEAAIAEDFKRQRKALDDFNKQYDAAIAEDYKRQLKIRNDFSNLYDQAVAEDYKRQRRALDDFNNQYDAAVAEDYKRQRRAQDQFLRDHAAALAEQARRDAAMLSNTTTGKAQQGARSAASRIVDLPVQLQANNIDKEMAAIRARIAALGDIQIGVNVDVETFADDVEREFRRLSAISRDKKIDIDVRVDAASAATELGGILVLLNRIDKDKATVKVDTDGALANLKGLAGALSLNLSRLGGIIALGASLGTVIVPAAAAAASAIGAIGTAALAAGSGVGVMALAFSGIGDAVKALGAYSDSQAKSNVALARSASAVVAANDQIKSAEMALANTRRNNDNAAIKSRRAIRDAIVDEKDAVLDVARANSDAAEKTAQAQRDATQAAIDDQRARASLTEAYRDARRALEDLNSSLRGNSLDQRQNTLDIAKAKADLDKLLANPRASEAEREQAQITYEQRLLQMDDLKRKGAELADEQDKQFQQGIEKADKVVKAKDDLAAADERNKKAQRDLAKAVQDQQRGQSDGLKKIKAAQQKIDDARAAAADQQKDAAYAEFTATQSLISAKRALAAANDRSSVAGGSQLDALNTAMAKLSPTAQKFARYIFGLKDAFFALRAAADPVLAGLQRAMESLIGKTSKDAQRNLQPLFTFVHGVAGALGDIFEKLAASLKGPAFTRFFQYIADTAVPTLFLMFDAFDNITQGVLNLFLAFTPLTGEVSQGFLGLTESFRKWSEGLQKNKGFQDFIAYLRQSGPPVMHLIGEIVKTVGKLVVAAAPVGTVVVAIFTKLFELINKIPEKTLIAIVAGIAAAAAAIALFAGATAIAALEIPGLIAGAIAVVVVAFSALVGSSDTLRGKLGVLWEAIKTGAAAAFGFLKTAIKVLRPVFDDMVEAALSFYNDGLKPAFDAVVALFSSFWQMIKPSLDNVGGFFAQLGQLAFFLYDQAILPAFKGIMAVARELFDILKPIFEVIGTVIGAVAVIVFWLLNKVFMPVVRGIVWLLVRILAPVFKFLWFFIRPILRSIGLAVQILAAFIKIAIGIIMIALKLLGMGFKWLYDHAIKPAWDALVEHVFQPMKDWIDKHIAPTWNKAMKKLGEIWASLKKMLGVPIKFVVETLLNDGLLKGYNWLADKFDIEPKNVKIPAPKGGWTGFAHGGAVHGPGTGTSDSIAARLSRGEHVLTDREVRAAGGHDVIYALRRALLSGTFLPGFARGGAVGGRGETGDGFGDWLKKTAKSIGKKASDVFDSAADFIRDPLGSITSLAKGLFDKIPGKDTWIIQKLISLPTKVLETLKDKVTGLFSGGGQAADGTTSSGVFGTSNALGGTGGMMQVLRAVFPGLALNSGFRPGAITVTGNRSYHSLNRAVDVPPRRDVFEWLRKNYPNSRELIFSPMGSEQIKDGRSHVYSGAVKRIHYNHVHWAYENGGLLPDTRKMPGGTMQVFHGRRTPDKVLTDRQWSNMAVLADKAKESIAGGHTDHWHFRDATLDVEQYNQVQARRDALNRVNRSNY